MKNVTGEALRMNTHQWRGGVNVTHHQGDGFLNLTVSFRARFCPKAVDPEPAPAGGEIRGCDWANCVCGHTLIIAAGGGVERKPEFA
jgi:hypothetical protein